MKLIKLQGVLMLKIEMQKLTGSFTTWLHAWKHPVLVLFPNKKF